MIIPDKIKIGGLIYNVQYVDKLPETNDDGLVEVTNVEYRNTTIYLNKNMSEQYAKRCLLHEILHAICDNLGFVDQDEKTIDEVSGALYALLVDNPVMFGE